jgi:AAA domain-containing protein/uncharacterized protein DUF3854
MNGAATSGETNGRAKSFLSAVHLTILSERGISKETAIAAGLRSAPSREAKAILGFDPQSSGILIPYTHPQTGTVRTFRFRPDNPPIVDGKAAKYLTPRGVSNLIYFPPGIGEPLKDCAKPLVVTEGEFKTLSAFQHGLLCVGLTGVWGWKTKADGTSQTIPDLELINVRGRAATIVFDSDVSLNGQVKRARHALGKELYKRGASTVYIVDLPASNGAKVGLDDYLKSEGLDAYLGLDVFAQPPTDIPPFLEPISTLLSAPEEPLEWGIEGMQPVGANGWRIAPPKVGKSWGMIEECYCLATAQPVYGHFRVPRQRRVMMIEEEDPKRRVKRRLERIINAHGGRAPSDEFFKVSIKKGFRLDEPKWREVFEFEIKSFMPEFCYLDVFNRLHVKDINDAQAMSEIVLFLDQLNRDYETAFIALHHDRKNGQGGDAHNEIMGSRVLGGFADATIFFARTKEKGVLRVSVALKDEPEAGFEPEFLIRLTDTEDGHGTRFEYLGAVPEKQASNALREKIKAILEAATDWLTIKEVADAAKVSKNTAGEHLDALVDIKVALKDKRKRALVYRINHGAQI